MRPATANPQQVSSFETQQQMQAKQDAEQVQRQQQLASAMQQLQAEQRIPGPESPGAQPMTAAQSAAIYGGSSNAPANTSNVSEAQAEAKQKELAREKQQQDALNSDTEAIDFERTAAAPSSQATAVLAEHKEALPKALGETVAPSTSESTSTKSPLLPASGPQRADVKTDPMAAYDFDSYQGRLYRFF